MNATLAAPRCLDFSRDPVTTARRLLGQRLVRIVDGQRVSGRIVEVEAYLGPEDRAAHTWSGRRTARVRSMWLEGGHAYVFRIYGMHHCFNVVCGAAGEGVAVLVRALEPLEGLARQRARRGVRRDTDLCSGPGRLAQALGLDLGHDGLDLRSSPELFVERDRLRALPRRLVEVTPRVGVDSAGEWAAAPLRFLVRGNRHVSRPRPTAEGRFLDGPGVRRRYHSPDRGG